MTKTNRFASGVAICGLALALAGCHTDMWRQPTQIGQEGNDFFPDKMNTRPPVEGTVAWRGLRHDDAFYKGRVDGRLVTSLPSTLTIGGRKLSTSRDLEAILKRGRERFEIFCTHCHGKLGDGKGMIAQRGLALRKPPASYHTQRLRDLPIGHFYEVITNGHGVMFPFAYRVKPDDRWAIAAYIRVLQRSQNVSAAQLSSEERSRLEQTEPTKETTEH